MKEISIYCTTTTLCIQYHACVTYLVALEKAVRSRSISTSIGFSSILSLSSSSSDVSFSLYGSLKQQCYTIITIPNSAKLSPFQMLLPTLLLYHHNVQKQWIPQNLSCVDQPSLMFITEWLLECPPSTSYLHPLSFTVPPFRVSL